MSLYLFSLFIPFPAPPFSFSTFFVFLYCFRKRKLQKAREVILATSAPQICSFYDGGVFIKWSFKALRCSFGLLNLLSKGYLNAWRFHFQNDLQKLAN